MSATCKAFSMVCVRRSIAGPALSAPHESSEPARSALAGTAQCRQCGERDSAKCRQHHSEAHDPAVDAHTAGSQELLRHCRDEESGPEVREEQSKRTADRYQDERFDHEPPGEPQTTAAERYADGQFLLTRSRTRGEEVREVETCDGQLPRPVITHIVRSTRRTFLTSSSLTNNG